MQIVDAGWMVNPGSWADEKKYFGPEVVVAQQKLGERSRFSFERGRGC